MSTLALSATVPSGVLPRTERPPKLPWELRDLTRLLTLNGAASVAFLVSWFGVSGTALLAGAATWMVVGIGALVGQGCNNVAWLLAGRRAVGERLAQLLQDLEQLPDVAATLAGTVLVAPAGQAPPTPAATATDLVAVAVGTRFHRADCQLALGKAVGVASRDAHAAARRTPCGVCQP